MQNLINSLSRVSLLAGVLLIVNPSQAEITLVDTASFTSTDFIDGNRTITTADLGGTFNAGGVDKLVVSIGGEGSGNGADDNTVLSVTYAGVPMTQAIAGASGNRRTSIWFLDNVPAGGDFVVTFQTNQAGIGFGAYTLNGTAPGFADTGDSGGTTIVEIDTTTAGEFVVASLGRNNFDELLGAGVSGDGQPADTVGVQPPLTELFYANLSGSSAASGYAILPDPKTHELIIYENNGSGRLIAAAFQAGTSGVLAITDVLYNPGTERLTLTWQKTGADSYVAKYSPDMTNWDANIGSGLTEDVDEAPEDAEQITVSFDLGGVALEDKSKLFFRIEEE